jgi:hypothetical protein
MNRQPRSEITAGRARIARCVACAALVGAPLMALAAPSDAFIARLRAALAAPDAERAAGLADLTALPFLYGGEPLDRARFIQRAVPGLFTPAVRRGLQRATPRADEARWVLWCAPSAFYLDRVAGEWRLVEFAADPL